VTAGTVEAAAEAALAGSLVVFPTDTVYGIGTRPDRPEATAGLFRAKGRERGTALPVLVPSLHVAREVAAFDERAERLAAAFWPGGLTLILPRTVASSIPQLLKLPSRAIVHGQIRCAMQVYCQSG